MNYAFIKGFVVYSCTPKVLHNHVCVSVCVCGGGLSEPVRPLSDIRSDKASLMLSAVCDFGNFDTPSTTEPSSVLLSV